MRIFHSTAPGWRIALVTFIIAIAAPAFAVLNIDGLHAQPLADLDSRAGAVIEPTAAQLAQVEALGAKVAWTEFGTPRTLIRHGGFLATGLSADPAVAARNWLRANASLFRLNVADVDALELYHVGEFAHSDARAVKFRQVYNGLASQGGGLVTVGIKDGNVAIATSSIVGIPATSAIDAVSMTAAQALTVAAQDAGFDLSLGGLSNATSDNEWTTFALAGHTGVQRARTMAFVTPAGPRPVFETWLVDTSNGHARAYMHLIDAGTGSTQGDVLFRQNKVFQAMDHAPAAKDDGPSRTPVTESFDGTYSAPPDAFACGPQHGAYMPPGPTYSRIVIVANSTVATNDIVVNLYYDDPADFPDAGPVLLTSTDVGFGEVATYEPGGFIAAGDYYAEVCPLPGSVNENWLPPFTYTGTFTFDDTPVPSIDADPSWNHFPANPPIDLSSTDTRDLGCWLNPSASPACAFTVGNIAARGPWDFDFNAGAPTNTTIGNAAISGEAWLSPLTPAEQYRPVAADRSYDFPWSNAWQTSSCSPTNFTPGGNDIDAAVVNMFVAHNRVHDFAYYLGFTEVNSNFQTENFGNTAAGRDNDAVLGNVQAGAVDGAFPAYLGRDNANFVPTPDGAPGITNQYLWQALLGAIYTPCADGNYDTGIVGHEIGHGIQHRMTGGPATGLGGTQGGEMGEGWGDLTGMEYQTAMGFVPTTSESPFAIGVYVLGSPERGIRNYNMSNSPLNYANIQYDPFGNSSPHADGEIWTATNFRVRQAMVDQHEGTDPYGDTAKQRQCAEGDFAPGDCPGNRRWIQIMHDGFLLQPAAPSMVDARDAQMAGDTLRFAGDAGWGDHFDALWLAYAHSGMGWNAASAGSNDTNPTADFSLPPSHSLSNADIGFVAVAQDEGNAPIEADIYVGHFEARANPIVTTTTGGTPVAALIAPGTYDFVVRADGYGHMRFTRTFTSGQTGTITIAVPTNYASASKGASAAGDGSDHTALIDDTEATNWDYAGQIGEGNTQVVTVTLGSAKTINRVQVSALSHEGGNRYHQLREFEVRGCLDGIAVDCSDPNNYGLLYASGPNAFDGQPIRPLAPNLLIKSFDLGASFTVDHLQFVAINNQCTGSTEFTHNNWATGAVFPDDVQDCRSEQNENATGPLISRDDMIHAAEFQVFATEGGILEPDMDMDGIPDTSDNCPLTPNADQLDDDADTVGNVCDNCSAAANGPAEGSANQCDTDGDGFGNMCDPDLNDNNVINFVDLGIMKSVWMTADADADLNCNGVVNFVDLGILKSLWLQPPGPSGIAP